MKDIYINAICLYGNNDSINSKNYTYVSELPHLRLSRDLKIKYYASAIENVVLYHCYRMLIDKYPDILSIDDNDIGVIATSLYGLINIQSVYSEATPKYNTNQFLFRQSANNLLSTLLCINLKKICYATTIIDPNSMGVNALEVAQLFLQTLKLKYVLVAAVNCINDDFIAGIVLLSTEKEAKYGGLPSEKAIKKHIDVDIGTVGSIYAISRILEEKL